MITSQIIQTIKEKAQEIPHIKEVIMHPEGADIFDVVDGQIVYRGTRLKRYPALVFAKDTFTSEFLDTGTNHRTITFRGWVIVPAENKENIDIWETILPNAVDAVLQKFDIGWDFGTIDGHRCWARMASGIQGYTPEAEGRQAWEELIMVVRLNAPAVLDE